MHVLAGGSRVTEPESGRLGNTACPKKVAGSLQLYGVVSATLTGLLLDKYTHCVVQKGDALQVVIYRVRHVGGIPIGRINGR